MRRLVFWGGDRTDLGWHGAICGLLNRNEQRLIYLPPDPPSDLWWEWRITNDRLQLLLIASDCFWSFLIISAVDNPPSSYTHLTTYFSFGHTEEYYRSTTVWQAPLISLVFLTRRRNIALWSLLFAPQCFLIGERRSKGCGGKLC